MSLTIDPSLNNSPTHSTLSSNQSGEFVMVSKLEGTAMTSKAGSTGNGGEEGLLQKVVVLSRENEDLKGILKHNNVMVQQYFQDLTNMQQTQKESQANLNKEHSKAKEVVTKLRERKQHLKNELQQANNRIKELEDGMTTDNVALRMNCEKAEAENRLLQSHVGTLQDQITYFDQLFKHSEQLQKTEAASESWKNIVDSMASLSIVRKPKPCGELPDGTHLSLEGRYAKMEQQNEIMEVDIEKLRIEKQAMVDQLQQVSEDYGTLLAKVEIEKLSNKDGSKEQGRRTQEHLEQQNKLQTKMSQLQEEKQELCRLLTETRENEHREMEEKKLFEATIHKLEETISKLQRNKREAEEMTMQGDANLRRETDELRQELAIERSMREEHVVERAELMGEKERISWELQHLKEELEAAKNASDRAFGSTEDDDDPIDKLKQEARREEMISYQRKRNEYEKRVNDLLGREKALKDAEKQVEDQKNQIEHKLAETREMMQAELESRAQAYNDQSRDLHSELEEGRAREESLREQVCQLIEDNQRLESRIEEESFDKMVDHSEVQTKQDEEETYKLQSQLVTTGEHLKRYQDQFTMLKNEYESLLTQHSQLTGEYDELMKSFQSTIDNNSKKQKSTSSELGSLRAQLEQQSAQLVAAEEAILKRDGQLRFMDERAIELQERAQGVNVLEQQIDVYRKDFAAEREAREKQHGELVNLRDQVQQLQEELDNVNQGQMAEMQRRHGSYVPASTATGFIPQPAGYPNSPPAGYPNPPPAGYPNPPAAGYPNPPPPGNYTTGNPQTSAWFPEAGAGGFFRRGGEPEYPGPEVGPEMVRREPDEPWICPGCRLIVENFDALQIHVAGCAPARHGNGPPQPGPDHSQPVCPMCQEPFPDLDTLGIHVNECMDRH